MSFHRTISLSTLIVISLLPIGSYAHPHAPKAQPIDVLVSTAKMSTIPKTLVSVGHLQAMKSVKMAFNVDGRLSKIYKQGVQVSEGEPVVALNSDADTALLRSLQADLTLAKSTYQRYLELKQYGGASKQMVEEQRASVIKDQALVDQQQVLVNQKTLKAPFKGVLGVANYSVGAFLSAGTSVITLIQQAPLKAVYALPASDKSLIVVGQEVMVTTSNHPNKKFTGGVVNFISPEVNQSTGTINVEAKIPNQDYLLSPGMFVSVTQVIDPNQQLLTIPEIAVMTDINGQYVYLVKGNRVSKRYVKVSMYDQENNDTVVESGLRAGDVVVTAGQQKITPSSTIHIIPMPKKETKLNQKAALFKLLHLPQLLWRTYHS